MSLPDWNMAGIVPPVRPGTDPAGTDRSPYLLSLSDFVDRFCISAERSVILNGLIDLRSGLHSIGITQGFQWVDGSFLENVEDIESRHPNDVDVVTYAFLPSGQTQQSFFPTLHPFMDRKSVKQKYKVDHYVRILPQVDIHDICYWYSLWSHRRDGVWKGYAQIDLAPHFDNLAATIVADRISAGFKP